MQLANSKIFNNRNVYRDKSEVKSGIEIVEPIFKDFITSQKEPKKIVFKAKIDFSAKIMQNNNAKCKNN